MQRTTRLLLNDYVNYFVDRVLRSFEKASLYFTFLLIGAPRTNLSN